MNGHDLPAAIKPRSRSFSSNVQRILGMTYLFSSLQPEIDQAVTLAQSVAHWEASSALSQHPNSLLQSHFFVFNPSSTRRRMASEREASLDKAHRSI
jgi:hypothetical protein